MFMAFPFNFSIIFFHRSYNDLLMHHKLLERVPRSIFQCGNFMLLGIRESIAGVMVVYLFLEEGSVCSKLAWISLEEIVITGGKACKNLFSVISHKHHVTTVSMHNSW